MPSKFAKSYPFRQGSTDADDDDRPRRLVGDRLDQLQDDASAAAERLFDTVGFRTQPQAKHRGRAAPRARVARAHGRRHGDRESMTPPVRTGSHQGECVGPTG